MSNRTTNQIINFLSSKNRKIYHTKEYNIWRQEVLKRADYKCEYCGNDANTAHHIKPQKLEPFFSLDPDYGVSCCRRCHYKYGHEIGTECSTTNLANILCEEKNNE
jgi:5-methylcytosine-specific restriction endonuclease McrA